MIIGLDVGGTNTDVVLLSKKGLIKEIKVPTNPANLFETVLAGLETITDGIEAEKIKRAVLSTTLTTNAIIQNKIPEVGMIVSSGPGIHPENYRMGSHYYTASGSIDHRGREIQPINPDEIKKIASNLKSAGIRHVGIIGKFSARNPSHETRIRELLNGSFENVFMGHRVSGNLGFPRRIATTYLNAASYPLHKEFYEAVKKSLDKKGLKVPIYILKADGGTISFESSIEIPAQTILSGPAASTMGAIAFAPPKQDIVVLDIGGTTTDISILIDRVPVLEPLGIEIGGYKTLIRSLQTHSIGIGGDSAIRIINGKITIGPDRLGPAMAFGGNLPTPTDALRVLGLMKEGDKEKSINGIRTLAKEIGLTSIEDAAEKIFAHACDEILSAIRHMVDLINSKPVYTIHELQEGYQVKPSKILILGGPAHCFAPRLEKMSHINVSSVPRWHVANAIGAAFARTTCEVILFADTEREIAAAPEENFSMRVGRDYFKKDAVNTAYDLLEQKALYKGASAEDLDMEILEDLEFNIVRGFYTSGKNIRVKVQVKPGLIRGYEKIVKNL